MSNRSTFVKPRRKANVELEVYRVPAYRVYYKNLDAYIERVFGFEFDFLTATGTAQGICPEYQVDGKLPTTEWVRRAQAVREGRRTRNVNLILNTLAADKKIPRGLYTISTHTQPTPIYHYQQLLLKTASPLSEECVRFKQRYKNDSDFTYHAARLDRHFVTHQ